MFNKLSFEELAELYGSLATLEKHYGKETVHHAIKEMAEQLDKPKFVGGLVQGNLEGFKIMKASEVGERQLDLFKEKEPKKRNRKTAKRRNAESIAKSFGKTLDEYLVYLYHDQKMDQYRMSDALGVSQECISRWLREIPQQTIKRLVGGANE